MNINDFNASMHSIRRSVDLADYKLEYDKNFPSKVRKEFHASLLRLEKLLINDANHCFTADPIWHTARRIVRLKALYSKIEGIRKKIIECGRPFYFTKTIKDRVLPSLANRIKNLKKGIGKKGRLPFSQGSDRTRFHIEVQQSLQMKNITKIIEVQREYFHLMGNYFDKSIESEIDVDEYDGNLEVYSLESWDKIIKLFIEKGTPVEKEIGNKIVDAIQKALLLAVKTSFAYNLPQFKKPTDEQQELTYFNDLMDLEETLVSGEVRKITQTQFLEKYELAKTCSLPKDIIMNEMAWDMVNSITSLQKGELRLFALGTCTHSIAVQVTCINPADSSSPGNYEYCIFNTGSGVNTHHELDAKRESAYPLTYHQLPLAAFSYKFCLDLLNLTVEGQRVDQFYNIHDVVFTQYGGIKVKNAGALYILQKFGTCSYSAIEAWIDSFLTLSQKKFLEFIKVQLSTSKQEGVVKILEAQQEDNRKKVEPTKKRRIIFTNSNHKRTKKLKENKILLQRGQNYLTHLARVAQLVPVPKSYADALKTPIVNDQTVFPSADRI